MKAKPIQHLNTGYAGNGFNPIISAVNGSQIQLYSLRMINQSGSASDLAALQTMSGDAVNVYTFTPPSTVTNVTANLLAGSSTAFFNATAASGVIIESRQKIHAFLVNVSAAQSGANTFTTSYSNGTGFTTVLQTISVPTTFAASPSQYVVLFSPGNDYAPGCGLVGTDSSLFQIRFACVSASTTCSINSLRAAKSIQFSPNVSNNAGMEMIFSENRPYTLQAGESLVPFYGVAGNSNKVIAFYQYQN